MRSSGFIGREAKGSLEPAYAVDGGDEENRIGETYPSALISRGPLRGTEPMRTCCPTPVTRARGDEMSATYMPILKWKRGELAALSHLLPQDRPSVIPM